MRVLVIGDVMLDVMVKPHAPINPTSDTPASVRLRRGGSGANLAVALSRGGHDVTYVGASGDDITAQIFVDDLGASGVQVALEKGDTSTGVVVSLVGADGQRAMLSDRGANSWLTSDHVRRQLAEPFDHLHVSGYTMLDENSRAVGVEALRRAGPLGASTSVDVCSLGPLRQMTSRAFLDCAAGATFLFANEEEALALAASTDVTLALDHLALEFSEVVVTCGARGALARKGGQHFGVTSASDDAFDTTGAGDAVTGTYLAVRLRGATIDSALREAMAAASVVVKGLGSRGQS